MVSSVLLLGEIFPCSFSRCVSDIRAEFLTSPRNFDEEKRVLSWGTEKLFVRDSYVSIANRILASAAAPVSSRSQYVYGLFGSPGIGKTSFIYYFLDRLIREKPSCLLIWTEGTKILYFDTEHSQFFLSSSWFALSQMYEVLDINIDNPGFGHENYQSQLTHFHLFVTSGLPNAEFYKFVIPHEHYEYMPTWSAFHYFS